MFNQRRGSARRAFKKVLAGGFTLVELLVVISIIALLLAILMPALQRAKMQAQTVVCGSHMYQYGYAVVLYAADHDDMFPPYADDMEYAIPQFRIAGTMWVHRLAPYVGGIRVVPGPLTDELREVFKKNEKTFKFRQCPGPKNVPDNWRVIPTLHPQPLTNNKGRDGKHQDGLIMGQHREGEQSSAREQPPDAPILRPTP